MLPVVSAVPVVAVMIAVVYKIRANRMKVEMAVMAELVDVAPIPLATEVLVLLRKNSMGRSVVSAFLVVPVQSHQCHAVEEVRE